MLVVKLPISSFTPRALASSVVKSAGIGPSSAVRVRGAGEVSTVISCSARCSGAIPTPSTDGTTLTVPPDTSNRASFAPLPKTSSSSPMAVCRAAGSMADGERAVVLRREGERCGDRRDRHVGGRAVGALDADGRRQGGGDRLVEHALRLGPVHVHLRDVDGQLDRGLRVAARGECAA